jgi:hypothetical protein
MIIDFLRRYPMCSTIHPTTTSWPAPTPEWRYYRHNVRDHLGHHVTHWASVSDINRIDIDFQQDPGDPDFTIFVTKNIASDTTDSGLYCNDCYLELDVPNEIEWNT